MSEDFEKSTRSRIRRLPKRGVYDKASIYQIIDAGMICHVSFVYEQQPYIIPTLYARQNNQLILHGASTSRMMMHLATGAPAAIAITHVDGMVLARSVFNHSINYRSVVLFGCGRLPVDENEEWEALRILTEHILPGRWDDVRKPNPVEMKATSVVIFDIDDASAKVRTGPPGDEEEDYALPVWAGVIPFQTVYGTPEPDSRLDSSIQMPDYLKKFIHKS